MYGVMHWIVPILVAASSFGAANGTAFSGGRYEKCKLFREKRGRSVGEAGEKRGRSGGGRTNCKLIKTN